MLAFVATCALCAANIAMFFVNAWQYGRWPWPYLVVIAALNCAICAMLVPMWLLVLAKIWRADVRKD